MDPDERDEEQRRDHKNISDPVKTEPNDSPKKPVKRPRRNRKQYPRSHSKCCVSICGATDLDKVSMFRFPLRDHEKYDLWIKAVKKVNGPDWKLKSRDVRICGFHFEGGKHSPTRTDVNYVPTIFENRKALKEALKKRKNNRILEENLEMEIEPQEEEYSSGSSEEEDPTDSSEVEDALRESSQMVRIRFPFKTTPKELPKIQNSNRILAENLVLEEDFEMDLESQEKRIEQKNHKKLFANKAVMSSEAAEIIRRSLLMSGLGNKPTGTLKKNVGRRKGSTKNSLLKAKPRNLPRIENSNRILSENSFVEEDLEMEIEPQDEEDFSGSIEDPRFSGEAATIVRHSLVIGNKKKNVGRPKGRTKESLIIVKDYPYVPTKSDIDKTVPKPVTADKCTNTDILGGHNQAFEFSCVFDTSLRLKHVNCQVQMSSPDYNEQLAMINVPEKVFRNTYSCLRKYLKGPSPRTNLLMFLMIVKENLTFESVSESFQVQKEQVKDGFFSVLETVTDLVPKPRIEVNSQVHVWTISNLYSGVAVLSSSGLITFVTFVSSHIRNKEEILENSGITQMIQEPIQIDLIEKIPKKMKNFKCARKTLKETLIKTFRHDVLSSIGFILNIIT